MNNKRVLVDAVILVATTCPVGSAARLPPRRYPRQQRRTRRYTKLWQAVHGNEDSDPFNGRRGAMTIHGESFFSTVKSALGERFDSNGEAKMQLFDS